MDRKKMAQDAVETMVDLRKGLRTRATATKALAEVTGLSPEIAAALLQGQSHLNVTQLRGYEKTPERIIKGRTKHLGRPAKK